MTREQAERIAVALVVPCGDFSVGLRDVLSDVKDWRGFVFVHNAAGDQAAVLDRARASVVEAILREDHVLGRRPVRVKRLLCVNDPDSGKDVLRVAWQDGAATVEYADDDGVRREVEEIFRRGLVELIDDGQRVTMASDREFLERLGADLARQFRFGVVVEEIQL